MWRWVIYRVIFCWSVEFKNNIQCSLSMSVVFRQSVTPYGKMWRCSMSRIHPASIQEGAAPIKTHADVVYPSEAADGKLRIRIGKGMIRWSLRLKIGCTRWEPWIRKSCKTDTYLEVGTRVKSERGDQTSLSCLKTLQSSGQKIYTNHPRRYHGCIITFTIECQ